MNIKRLKSWCGTLAHYNGIWVSGKHGFSKTWQRQQTVKKYFKLILLPQEQRPIDYPWFYYMTPFSPPTGLQPFIANQYHSKCVLSFQTNRCVEPDIHYVDKVIFIRWYFVGQTMVDNVCGDRKQVIAVNDPNSSLNYPLVHSNKMAVQLSHTYYDYQLSCMITDHWSVYWYYCYKYHYFGGNYSLVHTNIWWDNPISHYFPIRYNFL